MKFFLSKFFVREKKEISPKQIIPRIQDTANAIKTTSKTVRNGLWPQQIVPHANEDVTSTRTGAWSIEEMRDIWSVLAYILAFFLNIRLRKCTRIRSMTLSIRKHQIMLNTTSFEPPVECIEANGQTQNKFHMDFLDFRKLE